MKIFLGTVVIFDSLNESTKYLKIFVLEKHPISLGTAN
jgi:hypothetical protein